ncbi:MAG: MFS transporter [Lachnospiraceae bacterium]
MIHLLLAVIYLSFISLGLPDSVLGAAWPSMYGEMGVPVSYAGIVSMIISMGTVVSSLQSDRLTKRLGAGKVCAISVGMTAMALFGFSTSRSFISLCLWAVPYGLGAGSVDAALNNYVAIHYASRHMSWLHCMWGVGTTLGPYILGFALTRGQGWNMGYLYISILQFALTLLIVLSLPLWKTAPVRKDGAGKDGSKAVLQNQEDGPLSIKSILSIRGVREVLITFFCYCALEATAMLWSSSYLVLECGITAEKAAEYASRFFIGITVGRAVNGFLTIKFSDTFLVRLGQGIIAVGILLTALSPSVNVKLWGLVLTGLGCAPIYPCIIHSTPLRFGADKSQSIIGVQMASAYIGTCFMPPLFGLIANHISPALFPVYLGVILVLMIGMHELAVIKTAYNLPDKEV